MLIKIILSLKARKAEKLKLFIKLLFKNFKYTILVLTLWKFKIINLKIIKNEKNVYS